MYENIIMLLVRIGMQLHGIHIHIAVNEISTEMHELNPNQTMHHLPPTLNDREWRQQKQSSLDSDRTDFIKPLFSSHSLAATMALLIAFQPGLNLDPAFHCIVISLLISYLF